jgi:multiple sugar transport system permease protein
MAEVIKNEMEEMLVGGVSPDRTAGRIDEALTGIWAMRRSGPGNLPRLALPVAGSTVLILLVGAAALLWSGRPDLSEWRRWKTPAFFLLPVLAPLLVFLIGPILVSLFLSFTDFDIYSVGDWRRTSLVGGANYVRLWSDPLFWKSVGNTLYFVLVSGPLTIGVGLLAALLLNSPDLPLRGVFRTGYFLPVITPLVAVAVVWRWIYSPQHGILNWFVGLLGIPRQEWLADPYLAMPCLIALSVWKNFGYSMVIFLAGLQSIPRALYEAASIDGAGIWGSFRHVTLPLLRPTIVFVTIITTIGFMQFFAEPYIMTNMGGPRNETLSVVLYLYKEGFRFFRLGYASAMAYTLCAAIALMSIAQLLMNRRMEATA